MAGASSVNIKSGDQTRLFQWPSSLGPVYSTTVNGASVPLFKESIYSTFQAIITTTGGTPAAVVNVQVTNDDNSGRGYVMNSNNNTPGTRINVTNASTTATFPEGNLTPAMTGATVIAINAAGIPIGTTITYVSPTQGTLSNAATVTAVGLDVVLYANIWNVTALGTITLAANGGDGVGSAVPWRYVRMLLSGIGGTNAAVSGNMGV